MADTTDTADNPLAVFDAIECGLDAASDYVGSLPMGQRAWGSKEYEIARTAARAAAKAMQGERYVSKE